MEQVARELVEEQAMVSWTGDDGREILKFVEDMNAEDFRQLAAHEPPKRALFAMNFAQWLEHAAGDSAKRVSEVIG
jgi:hypothetical protein